MNPLDALTALTSGAGSSPLAGAASSLPGEAALPTGAVSSIGSAFPSIPTIENASLLQPAQISAPTVAAGGAGGPSTWGHMVQQMVMDVNSQQQTAAQKVTDVLAGGPTPVHEAMIATEEASLSFEFLSEMRNKVVDAYQQVMQMQV